MTDESGQAPGQPDGPGEPGYWERKAADEAAGQPTGQPPQAQFNPQSGVPSQDPWAAQYPPAAPYPQAGQPGWPPHPGPSPYVLPDHPRATTALVVGLVAVAGAFTCVLPILASPVAWVIGAQARREIRDAPHQWGGDGRATAGMVLGIIGTVLLVLGLIALAVLIVAIAATDGGGSGFEYETGV